MSDSNFGSTDAVPPTGTEGMEAETTGVPEIKAKPARKNRALLALAAAALLTGGTVLGTALPDPKASEAYVSLAGAKDEAESERDSAKSSCDLLKSNYDALESGIGAREAKATTRETDVGKAEAALKTAEAAVKAREVAVTGAEKKKAANTISDGTWTVGTDIAPGTYKSADAVGANCHWGIYESGTNGSNIIDNDIPGGGRPVVTLSAGQDFNSTRCGGWEKQ